MRIQLKIDNIYIISWFGSRDNIELREYRKKIHQRQLEWCKQHALHPVILAQDYNDDEYNSEATYVKVDDSKLLLPGPARNELLKLFYASDNEYGVFADNDTILYQAPQHGDSSTFIELLRSKTLNEFKNVDIIAALNPAQTPFSAEISKDVYRTHLVFKLTYKFNGPMFFLKNFAKDNSVKIFFDGTNFERDGALVNGEEFDFCCSALMYGHSVYHTHQAIYNEMGRTKSTWASGSSVRTLKPAHEIINTKHGIKLFDISKDRTKFNWSLIPNNKQLDKKILICKVYNTTNEPQLIDW